MRTYASAEDEIERNFSRRYHRVVCTGKQRMRVICMLNLAIGHFTVVCLVAWPLNESEAGVHLVLIETSLLFLCKFLLISMKTASLT